MNISEFISDHVLKINSQTRNYWQRSVFMAQHTLIRKREQVFTLQGPLRGSSSALRACFAVSTWARGSSAGAHVCSSCPPKSLLQERAASVSRVHRSPWGGGGGPQKEVESTFPVLRVQPSGPSLSPGEAAPRTTLLSGADGHRSAGRGAYAVRPALPAFPLCVQAGAPDPTTFKCS